MNMKKIQMVDLQSQYQNIKEDVDSSIKSVLESSSYINGPLVKSFQKDLEEYLNVKHVIPCANGTDALQIAMMGLGLNQGDEVITADFTFAATVEVIALLKLTPVLVDVEPDTFNIDIEAIKKAITPKTKAIVPVHLFGQVANMDAILEIAKEHNLFVIEDNAQAIGANYTFKNGKKQKAGTIGNVGTTSFFPSKNLGCYGDGGAIFTNDDELAHTIRGIVNHGMYKRYHHDVVGVNSRLDSIQAGVLKSKLPHLDNYCNARRNAARFYNDAFANNPNIITPTTKSNNTKSCNQICDVCDCHVFHQYTLKLSDYSREELILHLNNKGIPAMIYYPVPLYKQKAFSKYVKSNFKYENIENLCNSVFSLPIHSEIENSYQSKVIDGVLSFFNKKK